MTSLTVNGSIIVGPSIQNTRYILPVLTTAVSLKDTGFRTINGAQLSLLNLLHIAGFPCGLIRPPGVVILPMPRRHAFCLLDQLSVVFAER